MTGRAPKMTGRGYGYLGAVLGGAVSIAANVAHSYVPPATVAAAITAADRAGIKPPTWHPHTGAVAFAVVWPVFLFVAIEILARTPWKTGARWILLRFGGLLPVASVAAVVSYRHLSGLLVFYGEDPLTVAIGPLAVDGLMVMATGALIATSAARRTGTVVAETTADNTPVAEPGHETGNEAAPETPTPDAAPDGQVPVPATDLPTVPATGVPADPPAGPTVAVPVRAPRTRRASKTAGSGRAGKRDTATAIARLRARHPDMTATEIAKRLDITDRTVRRYLNPPTDDGPAATPAAA